MHRPEWLKVRLKQGPNFTELRRLVNDNQLNTICESAQCPNIWECWEQRTATFMILGDVCTRSCGFCAVKTGRPDAGLDWDEPERVAKAVKQLGLKFAVITSVNRDERTDGGAPIFARTIREIRSCCPDTGIEVLIPDFKGSYESLRIVLNAKPELLNHNLETVPRLYRTVRPQAKYEQSIELLRRAKEYGARTKTGIMVGLGESMDEIRTLMADVAGIRCDILTIGQYLQPTKLHLPVIRYYEPDEFLQMKAFGEELGIPHTESAPLVRSSYHAANQANLFEAPKGSPVSKLISIDQNPNAPKIPTATKL
ncbi:MAG: lipoyl synthase [Candidatus Latescibacteria bacterium]|jgi:lipoyl synthase|nr:lipoyl synthase [Candidatus Latescibacterota bacterium]